MTGIDELVRETLTADAATHHVAGDLAELSILQGRRIRRRRRAGIAALSVASVAGVIVGSLAVAGAFNQTQRLVIQPAGGHGGSNETSAPAVHGVPAWSTWPKDRVYGTKPGASFFSGVPSDATLLASGTLPDGMQFRFDSEPHSDTPVVDIAGFGDQGEWGDEPAAGSPLFRDHAPYFGYEVMTAATYDNGAEDGNTFWLVVVAQPGTTDAEYAEDGKTWEPMKIEHGIAVIKRQGKDAGIPSTAKFHLEDSDGTYYDGPADLL